MGPVFALFACALAVLGSVAEVRATGPTVTFTLPPQDTTPATFGTLPFPNDLYFDQGQPGDGDGTLINAGLPPGAKIGLAAQVIRANTAAVEEALDQLDGFGTTAAVYFFLSGPLDAASLPSSPVLSPSSADGVFCADTATLTPVPIALEFDVDSRLPNVLAVAPLPGRPLAPGTSYTCVVRTSVTGGGEPVLPDADWVSVRDGTSANTDADALFDPVVAALGVAGVPASDIAGLTVFTTQSTTTDLIRIRDLVLPGLPVPSVNVTSRPELVFNTDFKLTTLLGTTPHAHVAAVATGFFASPRFQTADPDGDGPLGDVPVPPSFASCAIPCETTDEAFVRNGSGTPIVQSSPSIPVTVVVPKGVPPVGGWPVIVVQHAWGGQRDAVVRLGEVLAAHGFAAIGIDVVQHGYRFFGCTPAAPCSQDTANGFGGTAVPDGFADGTFLGYDIPTLTWGLGFLQALHNFVGVRDNLRQSYVDLLSLVRLLHGHSIDTALATQLNDGKIFFMGHQLGGMVGVGFVAVEADVQGALLSGPSGYFATQLFNNSPSALSELATANSVLGLDPTNVADAFGLPFNLVQHVLDAADGANFASLLLAPVDGAPRNVIAIEGLGDQVIPNQSSEAFALAAGLPLFDPFVQNLVHHPLGLPVVATPRFVRANAASGLATAALLQVAAAHDAAFTDPVPGTLSLVPGFAHWDEFPATGQLLPQLSRGIRVASTGVLQAALDWFGDIAASGPPGTFSYGGNPNFNPIENVTVPAGPFGERFFARTVGLGGALATPEPTPDVTLDFGTNTTATRLTVARSTLGSGPLAIDTDVPPGPGSTVGTLGFLPFLVTVQREIPGVYLGDVTIAYSLAELGIAGITAGTADEEALVVAKFVPGTCTVGGASCGEDVDCGTYGPCVGTTYTPLPTTVDTTLHTATATGVDDFSTFVVLHPNALTPEGFMPILIAGGPGAIGDCRAEWEVVNPTNVPFRDRKGRVNIVQACHDGDPTCDSDRTANGVCTFRIAVCFNYPDPVLPLCTVGADPITSYVVSKPRPSSRDARLAANGQRLQDALVALGGYVTGVRQDTVVFTPPLAQRVCTALTPIEVAHKVTRLGTGKLRALSHFQSGMLDVGGDRLRLRCYPPT